MREYKPSNKTGILGIPLMLIAALMAGAVVGGTAFFISYQFNFFLIIIFPIGMGILGAVAMYAGVRFGKVRHPRLAALFGFLAGVAIIVVWRGAGYEFEFRNQLVDEARLRSGVNITQEEANQIADDFLEQETGQRGIIGYILYTAEQGSTLSYRSIHLPLNGFFTWIIWIVEWIIIVVLCVVGAFGATQEPFNERRNRWYDTWTTFAKVPGERRAQFFDLIRRGDLQNAGRLMTKAEIMLPYLEVDITGNEQDQVSDWLLKMTNVEPTLKNPTRRQLVIAALSPAEFNTLRDSMMDVSKV